MAADMAPGTPHRMNIVITGGAGFLGRRLAETLLQRGSLRAANGEDAAIRKITLVDVVPAAGLNDARLEQLTGDVADRRLLGRAITAETTSVFHLAAVVSGQAEADFDLGMRVNWDASKYLLEICRERATCARVVFTSSVAVYGGELPDLVPDNLAVTPQTSYGTQKAMAELLLNDYTRRGFVDGRALRLPTISVRAGRPNAAASSFASGIIREPLNGEESVCPVSAATRVWLLSPRTVTECFIKAHDIDGAAIGSNRLLNLPGMSISVGEMVAALKRVAGADVAARVRFEPEPRIEKMVATWPGELAASRARALGFPTDSDFDEIIRRYVAEAGIALAK
jgi:D-erythronate 2-dehydrogenase